MQQHERMKENNHFNNSISIHESWFLPSACALMKKDVHIVKDKADVIKVKMWDCFFSSVRFGSVQSHGVCVVRLHVVWMMVVDIKSSLAVEPD